MNCPDAENLMITYLDGQLSETEKAEFLNHLCSCNQCKLQLQGVEAVYSEIDTERNSFSPNILLAQHLLSRTIEPATAHHNAFKRYVLVPLVTAAALFAGFLLGNSYLNLYQQNTTIPLEILVEGFSDQYLDTPENNPYLYQFENQDIE